MINSHLCVVLLFYLFIFSFTHSRAGLNLLEEKARKKMNHGYGSLSAATQVGSSALGPDSSARADNYFLLLYVLFFLSGRSN